MKKIIFIFSVLFLAVLTACTEDNLLPDESTEGKDGYITLRFTLENIPDFKEIGTKAGGEREVETLSLMTFDNEGQFLGRVEASAIKRTGEDEKNGTANGTATASVPIGTKTIHFIANYPWVGNEYKIPANGQTETSVMPALSSSTPYIAWGRVSNITNYQDFNVSLLRNYAKVTVTSNIPDQFKIGGFALMNYVNKGTVVTWNENKETFDNITNSDNAQTKITQIPNTSNHMANQTATDCQNTNPKYLFEYGNDYYNQTCVIIKKQDSEQYYKIQLIDKEGLPFKIERNYIYKVVIVKFAEEATGSPSFEEAMKASPTNNIYAEVTKDAPTISDADGNTLTVTPLAQLFTETSTAKFNAKYFGGNGSLDINKISLQIQADANNLLSGLSPVSSDGTVQVKVTKPTNMKDGDLFSATILVKAGILSRIVTFYVSNQYSFEPLTGDTYSVVGDKVKLNFNIPETYPKELFPIKCFIEANDLNPDNSVTSQKQMLIEHTNGKYYYIYEATSSGENAVHFVTTRSTVENPTIGNEYFKSATFEMTKIIAISGSLQYATGSSSSSKTNIPKNGNVSWRCGALQGTITINDNGNYNIPKIKVEDSDQITFTYTLTKTNGKIIYEGTFEVSELKSKAVTLQPIQIIGSIANYKSNEDISVNKSSGYPDRKGEEYGSITVQGNIYTYTLPQNFSWNQNVRIYQTSVQTDRLSITKWLNATDSNMTL